MPLYDRPAIDLLAAYRRKDLSPVAVTQAVLARLDRWEPHLRAMYLVDREQALAAARRSEERWQRGEPVGALDGVPVTIKDNIAVKGLPTPLGTAATELAPAAADAPPAARLREQGALILGKTTMPDYGMLSSGLSSFHALTRNPWNLARNPGGSSSGAGAAAAAGYGPLHVGTDIGGSVRLPASWCGIVTLKPSLGRVPIDPPFYGRVAGPMTRTVADAALMMSVLSLPDARDHMSLPYRPCDWLDLDGEVRGKRIGLLMEAGFGLPVESEVGRAVAAAAARFADAGAEVRPIAPFATREMMDGLDLYWRMRSLIDLNALPRERRERVLPFIRAWAEGAQGATGEAIYRGGQQMMAMRAAANAAMADLDYILSPVAPIPAFAAALPCPTNDPARPLEHIGFTVAFNMSEQPAASVNCGYTGDGLPIGLQIVGRRFDDLGVLRMARAWEDMRDSQQPWPEPPPA
jgi:aspartyl-tRNA(Asn)/glutamyl-tRNA(Gln) amidotransferase subunit A